MLPDIQVRPLKSGDLDQVFEIYNFYVLKSTANLSLKTLRKEDQESWFHKILDPYFGLVLVDSTQRVYAWGLIKAWSERGGYKKTSEISIYVRQELVGSGYGHQLMTALLKEARVRGFEQVVARLGHESTNSLSFHKKHGFKHIGTMPKVGFKLGRHIDVHLLQKSL